MKLQQLRYLVEVAQAGLNVSQAAENLHTSQPGISKQIRLLEEELGVDVFVRNGKRIVGITEPGMRIVKMAQNVLLEAKNLREAGREFSHESAGSLTIATTHTQARYVLPNIIHQFAQRYPLVKLVLHQGNPIDVSEEVVAGKADIAIATDGMDQFADLCVLPCYQWNRCLVVKPNHPLLAEKKLTLKKLAEYPLITYDFSFTGRSKINQAFEREELTPNVVLTALDADVIKTYVELDMGVGIIAAMAYDKERDSGLRAIDVSHLFENSTTRIGIRRGAFLRQYTYDFIELFAPQLTPDIVREAIVKELGED
ncbi:MAG: HTH-type transcriptional regulator CysB [Betaproteobacteria bacterium]|nr:HTH-type transcriptional regulator CysB [Betaproteobacteria bacterium]